MIVLPCVLQVPALPRYASSHQRAAVPIPVTPSPTTRSRSTGSSSSSSGSPMRFQRPQRHSSSAGGFFSATASHLLGALSGISLISSSPTGNASSSSTSSSSGGGSFTGRRATGVSRLALSAELKVSCWGLRSSQVSAAKA